MNIPASYPLEYFRNYVDVDVCSPIFEKCNGRQFQAATKLDLCEFFNLRKPPVEVRILNRQKMRMCYLINRLYKHALPDNIDVKCSWLEQILAACGIDRKYYDSHYNDVMSKSYQGENKEFYELVKSIIGG